MIRRPNIQNIVARSDEFHRVREALVKQLPRPVLDFTALEERTREGMKNENK